MSAAIQFGLEVCGNLEAAEAREWLVTNGIGGYASGTIAGGITRRYHGLLVAALQPPVGRVHLVAALDEIVRYGSAEFALATHRWVGDAVEPKGFQYIEGFRLDGATPVWTYALGDARLEKRAWMQQGTNTTYVQYRFVQGSAPIEMELKALVNYRDFHASTHAGDWKMLVDAVEDGVRILAFDGAAPFYLKSTEAACEARHEWYRDCFLPAERARGLDDREDHLFAALFRAKLRPGESFTIALTTEETAALDGELARAQRAAHEAKIVDAWNAQGKAISAGSPEWLRQILLAFAKYVDGGMLPNNFPDAGGKPEYNTVDAALWYFEAVRQYCAATRDTQTLKNLFPVLVGIVDAHVKGTRYQIHVDPADGLLYSGQAGVQLTWMDAKVGDWVVTPRTGKAV